MDSINYHNLHAKKIATKPPKHHRHLRKIANLLRYIEVCVVLVLVSRLSLQLLAAVKNSSEYFRNFMGSPRFVFLLGNVIIITLFAQSGHFSNHASATTTNSEPDLYQEFLQNSTTIIQTEENSRKKKVIVRAENGMKKMDGCLVKQGSGYRRCHSEIVASVHNEKPRRVLQRSETERVGSTNSYPEDGMSNDEFRRKIEAFIARQQRLRTHEL